MGGALTPPKTWPVLKGRDHIAGAILLVHRAKHVYNTWPYKITYKIQEISALQLRQLKAEHNNKGAHYWRPPLIT